MTHKRNPASGRLQALGKKNEGNSSELAHNLAKLCRDLAEEHETAVTRLNYKLFEAGVTQRGQNRKIIKLQGQIVEEKLFSEKCKRYLSDLLQFVNTNTIHHLPGSHILNLRDDLYKEIPSLKPEFLDFEGLVGDNRKVTGTLLSREVK